MQNGQYVVNVENSQVVGQPVAVDSYLAQHPAAQTAGSGWTGLIILGVLVFMAVVAFFSSIVITRQQTVKVVERLGKFRKILTAGFGFKMPFIDRVVKTADMRIQQINMKIETKTKDNVFVSIATSVQVQIVKEKVFDAVYTLEDAQEQIESYLSDSIRGKVPTMELDAVFEQKGTIATDTKATLITDMEKYGYNIVSVLITDIMPAAEVVDAMNKINASSRLKEANTNEAEAKKITTVKNAEAEAEAKRLQGKGIADERAEIIKGMKENVKSMETELGVSAEQVLAIMMTTQYFDTIRDSKAQKIILMPGSPSGVSTLMEEVRSAIITGNEVNKK